MISVKELTEKLEKSKTPNGEVDSLIDLGKNFGLIYAIEIINKLAEEHNNGWIPCSERLPKENESVLLQDYECHITIERCKTKYGIIGFEDDYGWASANCSLAWQPLPEPYKEEV